MTLTLQNNYNAFKEDFKKDTGLSADKNVAEYIAYFNARLNDRTYQLNHFLVNQLFNELKFLPDTIGLRVAESVKAIPR